MCILAVLEMWLQYGLIRKREAVPIKIRGSKLRGRHWSYSK